MIFSFKNREELAKILKKNITPEKIRELQILWEDEFNSSKIGFQSKRTIQILNSGDCQWALSLLFSESDKIPYRDESKVWNWFVQNTESEIPTIHTMFD
jgi:hypothetical protein